MSNISSLMLIRSHLLNQSESKKVRSLLSSLRREAWEAVNLISESTIKAIVMEASIRSEMISGMISSIAMVEMDIIMVVVEP
jgi:hypothetical protein